MDARSTILAALAAAPGHALTRVQSQKLLFLIDKQLSGQLGGQVFNFAPYHYGPYDKRVYITLEKLIVDGLVEVDSAGTSQIFRLTPTGDTVALAILASLKPEVATHMARLATWVRSLKFAELVNAIYRAYPEMRVNSVFQA